MKMWFCLSIARSSPILLKLMEKEKYMSVVVDVVFVAKDAENYKALYSTMQAILPDTAAFDGAQLISCSADPENNTCRVHEVWETLGHQKAYINWRVERGDVDKLMAMLGEPPQFLEREHLVFG